MRSQNHIRFRQLIHKAKKVIIYLFISHFTHQSECDEFVFTVLRNGSEIELTDEQCKRMVDAINNSIREINEERENSSSEILGRRSRYTEPKIQS